MRRLRKSAATIGFYGDELVPGEITALLGAPPTVGVVKGGKWTTFSGVEKVAHTGSWRIEAERCEPENLNRQIEGLFAQLTPDLAPWRKLTRPFRGVVFCGLWMSTYNDGLELSPEMLNSIAERGLLLDLDIYESDGT